MGGSRQSATTRSEEISRCQTTADAREKRTRPRAQPIEYRVVAISVKGEKVRIITRLLELPLVGVGAEVRDE